ncbi:Hsp70 family protein [Micromonospora sp. NPDC051006]|uniref:Hsp70 family protein n=1 Tax=Micromonospora sp. NPDC051006 TaxID=3364283 RepID=UPI003795AB97
MNNTMLEEAARPVVQRAARLTSEAVTAAEISTDELAGVYCVGGGAHLPQLEKLIADQSGVAPTVVTEPALVAARGAADAGVANPSMASAVEAAVPLVRRAVAIAVPGFASLALIWQCLMTGEQHSTLNVHYWVTLNWGELTMAAVFALLACLGAGTILDSLAAAHSPTPDAGSEGGKISVGILAAVSLALGSRASTRWLPANI